MINDSEPLILSGQGAKLEGPTGPVLSLCHVKGEPSIIKYFDFSDKAPSPDVFIKSPDFKITNLKSLITNNSMYF